MRALALLLSMLLTAAPLLAQTPETKRPLWADSARYAGTPRWGAPRSDYDGSVAPTKWCLPADDWWLSSGSFLHQVLSDTTDLGIGWREILGGAPRVAVRDSVIPRVTDEGVCRAAAATVHRDVLGWRVGPPPVVVAKLPDGSLVVFPSNARMGWYGYAVRLHPVGRIRGVAMW